MKDVEYRDNNGYFYRVLVPDDAPESNYKYGIVIGPPSLERLDLPKETKVRLNNELYYRKLYVKSSVKNNASSVFSAVQAAFRVDTQRVLECYEA